MNQLVRANALKSTFGSLIPNALMSYLALRTAPLVNLSGPTPNLLSVLLPATFMSAFVTTLLTFATVTNARKRGQLSPALPATARWLPRALGEGLVVGLLLVGLVAAVVIGLPASLKAGQASRGTMLLAAMALGSVIALLTALLMAARALRMDKQAAVRAVSA